MPPTPVPESVMQSTYTREKPYHPEWPATFAEAMADPYVRACVDLRARHHVPTFGRRRADHAKVTGTAPAQAQAQASLIESQGGIDYTRKDREPTRPATPPTPVQPKRAGLDWKRKAAGERDDD